MNQRVFDKVWSEDNFRVYIKDPRGVTPGTKMIYPGLKDDAQITNLIADAGPIEVPNPSPRRANSASPSSISFDASPRRRYSGST